MNNKLLVSSFQILAFCAVLTFSSCHDREKQTKVHEQKTLAKPDSVDQENQIVDLILNIEEVKRKSIRVKQLSKGKRHLSVYVENPPTPSEPYYWVKVAEDNGDNYVTYYTFTVNNKTRSISYYDAVQDSLISLSQWRKSTLVNER